MRRRRAIGLFLFATISVIVLLFLLTLRRRLTEAQSRSDAFMAMFTPPLRRASTRLTLQLAHEMPPGRWPGIKPGWIIEYRFPAVPTRPGAAYYLSWSGEFLHSQPPGWLRDFRKHEMGVYGPN